MNSKEDIRSISYIKSHAADILKLVSQGENDIANHRIAEQLKIFDSIESKFFKNVKLYSY